MSKHTPGPWWVDDQDEPYADLYIVAAHGRKIGRVFQDDAPVHDYNAEQSLNACLISAAPDMLAALTATWAALQACRDQELWDHLKPARDASLAALAKAKGGAA